MKLSERIDKYAKSEEMILILGEVVQLEAENEALKGNDDGTEKCMNCESMVEQVWHTEDDAWNKLSGYPDGNGLLCIRCFDRKAQEQGVYLYWACQPDSFPKIDALLTREGH